MYAARVYGFESEANPFVRWMLEQGMVELLAVNLVATFLVGLIFYGLMTLLAETEGTTYWVMSRSFEVWIAFLLSAGLFVLANNLTVIIHGQNLF